MIKHGNAANGRGEGPNRVWGWTPSEAVDFIRSRLTHECPANRLPQLPRRPPPPIPEVDAEACTGCGACLELCMVGAIQVDGIACIEPGKCISCGVCAQGCPEQAILFPGG